jgi:hypothetical protein
MNNVTFQPSRERHTLCTAFSPGAARGLVAFFNCGSRIKAVTTAGMNQTASELRQPPGRACAKGTAMPDESDAKAESVVAYTLVIRLTLCGKSRLIRLGTEHVADGHRSCEHKRAGIEREERRRGAQQDAPGESTSSEMKIARSIPSRLPIAAAQGDMTAKTANGIEVRAPANSAESPTSARMNSSTGPNGGDGGTKVDRNQEDRGHQQEAAGGDLFSGYFVHGKASVANDYIVKDISLADFGRKELNIAETEMPGLMATREEYGPNRSR